jgi:hypothetical protein
MVIIIIILSIFLCISLYGNFNILKKFNKIEKMLSYYIKKEDSINTLISNTDIRLKELDEKGAFESDDEVGFFFKYVKEIQSILNSTKDDGEKN